MGRVRSFSVLLDQPDVRSAGGRVLAEPSASDALRRAAFPPPALPPGPGASGKIPEEAGLRKELEAVLRDVKSPSGGLVFVAGALAGYLRPVAELVRAAWPGVPAVIVPAAGVLTEREEIEGRTAATGLVWSGGLAVPWAADDTGEGMLQAHREAAAQTAARVGVELVFPGSEGVETSHLVELGAAAGRRRIIGGGAARPTVAVVDREGETRLGRSAGMSIVGLGAPMIGVSAAARMVTDFLPIERSERGMVLELGGRSALAALAALVPKRDPDAPPPVVFAALEPQRAEEPARADAAAAETGGAETTEAGPFILRPIRGIDPDRGGLLVGADAAVGRKMAFAVRDAAASRAALDREAGRMARALSGALPRFGIYVSCAGRGQSLYGAPDVDVRILRRRFADVPFAGLHSSFEIASVDGATEPSVHLFSGVWALFRTLS